MVSAVRWARSERLLPGTEVDSEFETHPDTIHLFAFTTDRMRVGEHSGKLSVKAVTHGSEHYQLGRRSVRLRPGQLLVVNEGQSYSSYIEEPGTRSISFFLPTQIARERFRTARQTTFDPIDDVEVEVDVFQVPFLAGARLRGSMHRLSVALARPGHLDLPTLEEHVLAVSVEALYSAIGIADSDTLSDRVRRSTREELLDRVMRARDLIHDSGGRSTLPQMAAEAGLSDYHFLRTFEAAFGTTPGRYARQIRLARGRARLARGEPTIVAARAAGYRSSSAFLRALRAADRRREDPPDK